MCSLRAPLAATTVPSHGRVRAVYIEHAYLKLHVYDISGASVDAITDVTRDACMRAHAHEHVARRNTPNSLASADTYLFDT